MYVNMRRYGCVWVSYRLQPSASEGMPAHLTARLSTAAYRSLAHRSSTCGSSARCSAARGSAARDRPACTSSARSSSARSSLACSSFGHSNMACISLAHSSSARSCSARSSLAHGSLACRGLARACLGVFLRLGVLAHPCKLMLLDGGDLPDLEAYSTPASEEPARHALHMSSPTRDAYIRAASILLRLQRDISRWVLDWGCGFDGVVSTCLLYTSPSPRD